MSTPQVSQVGAGRRGRTARFGVFELDLDAGELRKRGMRLRLQQQPCRVLEMLIERRGQVVSRDDLRQRLWPSDTYVDFDHGLNKAVNKLREALGDSSENPRFIETLPKRGYRFIAPVELGEGDNGPEGAAASVRPEAAALVGTPANAVAPPRGIGDPQSREPASRPATEPTVAVQPVSKRRLAPVVLAAASLVAVISAAVAVSWRSTYERPAANRTMLAVLPFANLEGDVGQEYFCDGMTDEMILQLSRMSPQHLGVIARTSSMHYRDTAKRIDEISRELGVEYVLEGSVRRNGGRVRITARLVKASDQTPLWAESYERDVADVFEIQTEVARRIAESLALELLPENRAALDLPRATSEAYEAYLKGRFFWNRRKPADMQQAVALFQEAIAKDPSYVPSYAGLADALNVLPWYGLRPPRDAYPWSKEVARHALAIDETSAAAHTALAYAHHYFDWSWPDAEREYARALELNPSYAQARQWRAAHYSELGRFELALAEEREAERLDPRSLIIKAAIGWIQYHARRYGEAAAQLRRTLDLDPNFVPARLWLGQVYEASGHPEKAIEEFLAVRALSGSLPTGLGELAHAYAVAGRQAEARALLHQLEQLGRERYVEADLFARVHLGLGDIEGAMAWLNRGLEERAVKMVLVGVDPQFDPLRADPRFKAIVTQLKLPNGAAR